MDQIFGHTGENLNIIQCECVRVKCILFEFKRIWLSLLIDFNMILNDLCEFDFAINTVYGIVTQSHFIDIFQECRIVAYKSNQINAHTYKQR